MASPEAGLCISFAVALYIAPPTISCKSGSQKDKNKDKIIMYVCMYVCMFYYFSAVTAQIKAQKHIESSSSFEGYPLQVRHKQDWDREFILLLTQTAELPESDAGSGVIKQHRVSSSKTVRLRAPCGARCIGHAVRTWSAVCSEAPHSQFGEGARPRLCMGEWNPPTPVCRRLSLTQATRGKPIPTGLAQVSGTKARSLEAFSQYFVFHL